MEEKEQRIIIVGCGVAGIFTAIELVNKGYDGNNITMLDRGHWIDKRRCFVDSNTACKKCKICSISNGVGGTGSFSDSKLNFDISGRVGGDLAELLTVEEITKYLEKTYKIYQQFGIEEFKSKIYGKDYNEEGLKIIEQIKNNPNMEMADCVTIHLGTDNSQIIYKRMIDFLLKNNVHIMANAEVTEVDTILKKVYVNNIYFNYDKLVLAMGRSGNQLMREICVANNIKMKNGRVDYGVRVETLNEYMKPLNDNFYEAKIYIKGKFGDSTRIFCTNPQGVVSVESYPYMNSNIYLANGHAYAEQSKKTKNTNFALLVSRSFNEDCTNPLGEYLYPIINATNSLGKGSVILQSLKDIRLNRRSTEERIAELDIIPTANVYKGDILSVMPYRTMVDILEAIEELDKICVGLNGDNTLLYSMEAKFHSNKVLINKYGQSSVKDVYCIGDSSGWTRGITSASSMGILCAEDIIKNRR